MWIGKKDKSTGASFLDRNGLAPNRGRVYVYAADDGTTDMATYLEWPVRASASTPPPPRHRHPPQAVDSEHCRCPASRISFSRISSLVHSQASGNPTYTFNAKTGKLKPIAGMWDGRYSHWFAAHVNTLKTTDGSSPIHMTNRGKQEWGSSNPDKPNQWAIAETGLGGSQGGKDRGCSDKTDECPMGTSSSTVAFLQAEFLEGFSSSMSGNTKSRDGTIFPDYFPAQVTGQPRGSLPTPSHACTRLPTPSHACPRLPTPSHAFPRFLSGERRPR